MSAVSGLAVAQAALGHSVTVLTTDVLGPGQRITIPDEVIDGVRVIRRPNLWPWLRRFNLSSPLGLRRSLDVLVPDVIHCHELRTVENLIVSLNRSVPLILSPHGTLPHGTGRSTLKLGWDRLFGRALARRFRGIVALTEQEADGAQHLWTAFGLSAPAIRVIPNGVQVPDSIPTRRASGLNVLFLGRLQERKGLQFLIPAFARAAVPGSQLTIVGPDEGMLVLARQLVAELGIADQVRFTGLLTGQVRDQAFAEADLFVLPAVGEGLSVAALEAMAAGLPVILTPGCNLPEVEARGAGLIVEREIEPLALAIRALLTDPAQRARRGAAGHRWMAESFTWSSLAKQVLAFYADICF